MRPVPRRELSATIDGRDVDVTLEQRPDGRWQVTIDGGQPLMVDAHEIRRGTWSLVTASGRALVVDVDRRSRGTALLVAGEEVAVEMVDARQRRLAEAVKRAGGAGARGEVVRAPIAGKLVKLLVAAGDEVAAGQGVAVLEAMKMENEIRADRGGAVATIHVEPGQSVDTQEPLITLS